MECQTTSEPLQSPEQLELESKAHTSEDALSQNLKKKILHGF